MGTLCLFFVHGDERRGLLCSRDVLESDKKQGVLVNGFGECRAVEAVLAIDDPATLVTVGQDNLAELHPGEGVLTAAVEAWFAMKIE